MKKTFKILLFTTLALGCCGSIDAKKKQKFDVNPDLPMSIRMAQSEIIRNPEGWMLDFSQKLKWNYCTVSNANHSSMCMTIIKEKKICQSSSSFLYLCQRLCRYHHQREWHHLRIQENQLQSRPCKFGENTFPSLRP